MNKTGVYFLLKRKEIVYIGQTAQFPMRFNNTNSEFDFDRIRFIECRKLSATKRLTYWELGY